MTAAHKVLEACYSGFDKCFLHVSPYIAGRRSIEWQVTTLGANYKLVARESVFVRQFGKRGADGAFASLKSVIRRRVDYVCSQLHSTSSSARIAGVSGFVWIAQICANADRRQQKILLPAEVVFSCTISEAIAIASGAFSSGVAGYWHGGDVNTHCTEFCCAVIVWRVTQRRNHHELF